MSESVEAKPRRRRWLRRGVTSVAVLATLLAGVYAYQPIRYSLTVATPPEGYRALPLTKEDFFRSGQRVLMVVAHPDDAEFYSAATLLQLQRAGATLRLLCLTDGDKGYYPFGDAAALAKVRRREQDEAAAGWGGDVVYVGLPDGRLSRDEESVAATVREIEGFKPTVLMIFDPDYHSRRYHRDHVVAGEIGWEAAQKSAVPIVLGFQTTAPSFFVDATADWPEKERLLALHASQFSGAKLERIKTVIRMRGEDYGRQAGHKLAEGFRVLRARAATQ